MADWNNPTLSTTYTSFLTQMKDRDNDAAVQFSPTYSTATNLPTGAIRWNPTNKNWEIKGAGGSFGPLTTKFMIDVDKLDGQDGSYYLSWDNLTGVPSTFTPSAHTHDDRYYTETEANARFSGKLIVSGNTIKLQTPGSADLSTITVPYATAAADATTVGGFSVGQNLLTTSAVTFGSITSSTNIVVLGSAIILGDAGETAPTINFWDEAGAQRRSLRWNSGISEWQVEDSTATMQCLFHEGHYPNWTEVAGKPTTFAPSPHGHTFTATAKAVLYGLATAALDTYTGSAGEITYNTTLKRLVIHDGTTAGGFEIPTLGSNIFTAGQIAPTLRATSATAITLSSTGHAFQTGLGTSTNMVIDTNKIQVRENGAATAMFINPLGGDVTMGDAASLIATLGNFTCFGEASISGKLTGLSQIFATGSVTTPAFSFASDPDTGMYLVTTNTLGFSTGGTEALRLNSVGAIGVAGGNYGTTGQVLTSNGSSAAPTWSYPSQLSTASGSAPSYSCRAWVNFNGNGTVGIRAAGNVSSVTDNGVGDYTVNFTTAMPDTNYAVNVTASGSSNNPSLGQLLSTTGSGAPMTKSTTQCRIGVNDAGTLLKDPGEVFVTVFR